MAGPYRDIANAEVLEADTRDGMARLEVGPRHTLLELCGHYRLSVADNWVTVVRREWLRRKRSYRLEDHWIVVARGLPTEELGFWYQEASGRVLRLAGLRPPELIDEQALAAWRQLDAMGARLGTALRRVHGAPRGGWEFGVSQNRVLVVDYGDRYIVYARPLFRERQHRLLEVRADGAVIVAPRGERPQVKCRSRYAVTVSGDRLRFDSDDGQSRVVVWLPWISPEDRRELAVLLGHMLHRAAPGALQQTG